MNSSKAKKCISILLSMLMAFGILNAGALCFTSHADEQSAVLHFIPGEGFTELSAYAFGSWVDLYDGDTVPYGSHIRVEYKKHDAYALPIKEATGETYVPIYINGVATLDLLSVNTPEVIITTDDLEKKEYKLIFDALGGVLVGDETTRPVKWNEPLPEAIRAVRPGYTFLGYWRNFNAEQLYDQDYTPLIYYPNPSGNSSVVAHWEATEYNITVDPNGGSLDGFEVQYVFDGSGTVYPDAVTEPFTVFYTIENTKSVPYVMPPAGYSFTGWAVTGEDHGWPETAAQSASVSGKWGDVTLTAQYEAKTNTRYYVRYYVMNDDGTYPASPTSSVTRYGTTDTLATAEVDPPEGFHVDTDRSVLTGNINGMGNRILKVYYAFDTYTVTFRDEAENVLQQSDWRSGVTPVFAAELPEKAYDDAYHYTAGWDREIVPAAEDAVYTLVFTPETHNYVGYAQISAATCVANALEQGACACGKTDVREAEGSLDPDAHSYVSYVYNGDAAFTADGTETALCEYDASHTPDTRTAPDTAFCNRYSAGAPDVIAAAETILGEAQANPETYTAEYIEALSGALDAILHTDANYLTADESAAIEQTLTALVNGAGSHMLYDRTVQFRTISRMHYVIDEGDGFAVYTSSAVRWYSSKALKFHVYVYTNFPYETYKVYINNVEASPDENGVYTIPAGSYADTVSIIGATEKYEPAVCDYCGKVHDGTFWGRIVAFFHMIFAFFVRLFNK